MNAFVDDAALKILRTRFRGNESALQAHLSAWEQNQPSTDDANQLDSEHSSLAYATEHQERFAYRNATRYTLPFNETQERIKSVVVIFGCIALLAVLSLILS